MSELLDGFLARSRLPEATAAFAGFIAGDAAFRFATENLPTESPGYALGEVEAVSAGLGAAIAAGGLTVAIRSIRNRFQETGNT